MAMKNKKPSKAKLASLTALKIGFIYVAAYMASIIAIDAWDLITDEAVRYRWFAAIMLLVVNLGVWYSIKINGTKRHQDMLIMALVLAQVLFASLNVYWERGMASNATALFIIPIITAAVLANRKYLYTTAAFASVIYSTTVYRYFYDNYGEGYLVQLWVSIGFFSVIFMLTAGLISVVAGINKSR